jgi:hypothetical protein
MIDSIKKWFGRTEPPVPVPQPAPEPAKPARAPRRRKKVQPELSAKELATQEGRPYVNVLGLEFDPANPNMGSFELDWNEMFIKQLMMSGYRGETDEQIVDQWFQDVCRNVVLETWEQNQADPVNRTKREDLGNGRTAVS